ncbi:flagellar biosynthetic protein FliO [Butyrivibrio sp. AE2032]|uniref:flagellar biosynthetic protein FliO n=1 Tax=Butyrivibrio sp. AE2032 TaxID=1458463 RepID=UPI00068E158B|nr:flagellar biosynthetic protein FliO [Butyrivibrio sp. AE2032]
MSSYLQLVFMLLIFVAVLAATYFFTKWIAGFQKEKQTTGNIEVIETARISATKYIQIVRIGQRYMAIGVGKDEITNLGEVSREDLNFREEDSETNMSFKDILEKFKGEIKK